MRGRIVGLMALAVLAGGVFALSACGGDDETTSASSTTTAAEETTPGGAVVPAIPDCAKGEIYSQVSKSCVTERSGVEPLPQGRGPDGRPAGLHPAQGVAVQGMTVLARWREARRTAFVGTPVRGVLDRHRRRADRPDGADQPRRRRVAVPRGRSRRPRLSRPLRPGRDRRRASGRGRPPAGQAQRDARRACAAHGRRAHELCAGQPRLRAHPPQPGPIREAAVRVAGFALGLLRAMATQISSHRAASGEPTTPGTIAVIPLDPGAPAARIGAELTAAIAAGRRVEELRPDAEP